MKFLVHFLVVFVLVALPAGAGQLPEDLIAPAEAPAKAALEIPAKIDAAFRPEAGIEYTLARPFLYRTSDAGPAESDNSIAWSQANEFVFRTALAKDYTLPAQESGPTRAGWCQVTFTSKDGKCRLIVEVHIRRRVMRLKRPVDQNGGANGVEGLTTELTLAKTYFTNTEPIIVDVYVENSTTQDIHRAQFSPISSSVGLPSFVFVRVSNGKESGLNPGLLGDDWDAWYQPASGREAFQVGDFILPAKKKIHLLHGDLRETVMRARRHCQRALDEERALMDRPENASTKKSYEEIVRFADDFLGGGSYDIRAQAYSPSPVVRIQIESQKK